MSKQLSLFPAASDSDRLSLADNASDTNRSIAHGEETSPCLDLKTKALQRFLYHGKDSPIAHVNTYSPGRRSTEYYRLSYRIPGNRMKHKHIPGGSTTAELAQYRAKKLLAMVNRGAELVELLAAIEDWRK